MKNSPSGSGVRAALLTCATACAFTSAHAQNGTWIGTTSAGLWSDSANWAGGVIADGSGNTADFSTIDVPDGTFIAALDSPRTIGSLTFGDTDTSTAGFWVIDNNIDPLNILTLDGSPVITVNALGTDAFAEISAQIAGSAGLTKAGPGTLTLSGPNTYGGTTSVNAGTLNISNATALGTSTLTISGGDIGNIAGAITLTNNNVQNWNSNFTFAGPGNLALGTGAVSIPADITVTAAAASLNVGGVITGAGTFTKDGAGELLLSGANAATFTGPMTLKGGLLRIRGNLPSGATGIALNQEPIGPATKTITFEGGALMLNGATGSNGPTTLPFTNPLVIAAGQAGTVYGPQRGDFNSTITGSGNFNYISNYVRGNVNGNWTGFTGTVNASGVSTTGNSDFRVNGTNVFHAGLSLHVTNASIYQIFNPPNNTIGTTHQIGKLSGTSQAFLGGSNVNGRFVNWQVGALNQDSEYAGVIANSAGAARLYKVGTGMLTLSGANTYNGDTQLNGGTLKIGNGASGSLGATNVITTAGTTLIFDRDSSADSAYAGILSGPGTVIKRGDGRVNFNGANTYTAGTSIEGGTIGINGTSSLGDPAGAVSFTVSNGGIMATVPGIVTARAFNVASGITASFGAVTAADSYEITSSITGGGSLAINGGGVITLSGANAYGGSTTVSSGTLVAANISGSATSAGAVSLNSGTLGGSGSIAGVVTTASGSHVRPGPVTPTSTGVGTLTTGSLALAGGTTLHAEFTDDTTYDKIVVSDTNGLTAAASLANPVMVDLRVANSIAKWTTPGTYDLIQFPGSFSGSVNDLFEVDPASQQAGLTYTFSVSGNSIRLTIGGALPSIWNVDASGNWSVAGNWLNGSPNSTGATATFGSAITGPRTVTLDVSRTAGILQFNSANSYTIAGTTPVLTLDQSIGSSEINVLQGDHTISAKLALTDPLAITLASADDSLALLGDISGAGGITKSSAGDVTLGGANTFAGGINFSQGLLTFANNSLGSGSLALDAATLAWSPSNTQDISNRAITFGNSAVTFLMDSNVTLANDFGLTGTAPFNKDGVGTLTLAADTTFAGNVSVLNGALTLGSGGTSGSVLGDIALSGAGTTLTVNRSDSPLIANLISGVGDLVLSGAGDKALNRANTFTGSTTITAGKLVLLDALALQGSKLIYNNGGGTLDFDNLFAATLGALEGDKDLTLEGLFATPVALTVGGNGAATTYTGVLSGGGSFVKSGAGTMILSGAHTFSGTTTVSGGALELEPTAVLNNSAITVGATGRMSIFGGSVTSSGVANVANSPAGPATFELISGSASFPAGLNATGNSANNYLVSASGGTLSAASMSIGRGGLILTAEPVEGSAAIGFYVNGADVDIAGGLSMGVTSGANSSVSTRVDSGSLDIGGPIVVGLNNGGRWSVIDVNGGAFTSSDAAAGITLGGPFQGNAIFLSRSGVSTVERFQFGQGAIAGTSTVHVLNFGELYVGSGGMVLGSTAPGFVATLKLSGGILGAKADWSTALPVATAGNFAVKAADAVGTSHNITFTGAVSGSGSLDKTGGGTLALNGGYSYTGSTTVSQGTLILPTATLSDIAAVEVKTGGVLNLTHGEEDTVSALLVDGVDQGVGTFTSASHPGLITGSGSLRVVADPFAAWIAGYPALTGPDAEKSADPDLDGLSNFEEFALNGDPANSSDSGKVRARTETVAGNQALVITLPVRDGATFDNLPGPAADATIDQVVYTIRGSNNLGVFDQGVTEIAVSSSGMPGLDAGWTYHSFRLNGNIGGGTPRGPKGFLDIQITETP